MRCKIFVFELVSSMMEEKINRWLAENPNIKILNMAQSSASGNTSGDPRDGENVETTLTIFYAPFCP
ncbi:MAG: hypothetical protein A2591_01160 [Candidatus Yonathbacteria bacterium RIFOXYD1_FULL_52_36]|uniref:Uncharacterized protein n=1 Tax=Candidatus Yonathbacteria bacterium RIFOXYD1_FULL_52_36 TaxID=1802730 RepID=A0A1G2SJQ4_9BACT|nr:MAG: hypothetical protein A2591_01160 [Candidatus Yonathbacteria bacterium RIFOXYD1_FULL_52_36]